MIMLSSGTPSMLSWSPYIIVFLEHVNCTKEHKSRSKSISFLNIVDNKNSTGLIIREGTMENILMITFWGNMYLFKNNLNEEECASLQAIADSERFKKNLDFKDTSSILPKFLDEIKTDLGISLDPVKISHIIRIR
jgi:hypothetical protein